jgi:hypothetical protein
MAFFSCINANKDDIIVIGQAENAKAGAIVISSNDDKIYYIDRIDSWDKKIKGRVVRVSGKLLIEKTTTQKQDAEIEQQIEGIKRTIKKPRWALIAQ